MAETRSMIIVCEFICTLFASNSLMCSAKVNIECKTDPVGGLIEVGKAVIVGSCLDSEACDILCFGLKDTVGFTIDGKSGVCVDDFGINVCACCRTTIRKLAD
ncbi:hypothetical protein MKX03_002710 [Papaver bracteatum]|nr:hypothetical protein MKX03_002710 [Papaver bracteatum]